MAPKSEEDRYFSPIFFSFRCSSLLSSVFSSSPENNNFLTPFFVVGSLFSFSFQMSKRKKRKHMGEILGWWERDFGCVWTDDFGATSSSSKIPASS